MIKITNRFKFPKCIRKFKEVKGIAIGQCIDPNTHIDKDHIAHAHCFGPYKGWICFKYKYHMRKNTLLHEVAHLKVTLPRTAYHGKAWRETLLAIGGTFKSYTYKYKNKIIKTLDYTYRPRKI